MVEPEELEGQEPSLTVAGAAGLVEPEDRMVLATSVLMEPMVAAAELEAQEEQEAKVMELLVAQEAEAVAGTDQLGQN